MSWHATAQWRTAADTASRDEALSREAEAAKDGQLATQADEQQPNPQQPMEEPCTDDDWTSFLHPCDVSPATSPAFVRQVQRLCSRLCRRRPLSRLPATPTTLGWRTWSASGAMLGGPSMNSLNAFQGFLFRWTHCGRMELGDTHEDL